MLSDLTDHEQVNQMVRKGLERFGKVGVLVSVAGMLVLGAGVTSAQNYPNKPIRIVASAPGGGGDFGARLIAPGLSDRLGQRAIVDNRGGGMILGTIVSQAPADGYTLPSHGRT